MPGGSSGGESAAVAAGMSPLGLGSDLGSSIRQPAAWTGVFGVKASRGLTALAGHAFFGLTPGLQLFATIGPLARSAQDLRLGLEVLVGGSLGTATPAPRRIAVYEEDGLQPVAAVCREAVRLAAGALAQAGHELVDDAPPAPREVRAGYDTMLATELAVAALPQLRGREADLFATRPRAGGRYAAASSRIWRLPRGGRQAFRARGAAGDWLERHPVSLCPVTPVVAPPAAEGIVAADGRPMNAGGKLTLCTYANALGLPAVSVPVMRDEASGMPVGVQLFGRPGHDAEVLALAEVLERALGGFLDPEESPASALRLD